MIFLSFKLTILNSTHGIIFSCWSHKEELRYGVSKLGFLIKKKCCHVRMLSSNKSCGKDNLDGVIDVQQYNPLDTSAVKRVKDSSCDTHICYHWRATRQIHRVVSSCSTTQRETKWQASERRAKKYGPATIREVQIAVSEVLGWLRFNTAAFRGC